MQEDGTTNSVTGATMAGEIMAEYEVFYKIVMDNNPIRLISLMPKM